MSDKHPVEKMMRKAEAEALREGRKNAKRIKGFCPRCGLRGECKKCTETTTQAGVNKNG